MSDFNAREMQQLTSLEEKSWQKAHQHIDRLAQHERTIQNHIIHACTIGLICWIWRVSKTSILVYFIPAALCICMSVAVSYDGSFIALGFAATMVTFIAVGIAKAQGLPKIVSMLHAALAVSFAGACWYRFTHPLPQPSDPDRNAAALFLLAVGSLLCFLITLIADLVQGSGHRQHNLE